MKTSPRIALLIALPLLAGGMIAAVARQPASAPAARTTQASAEASIAVVDPVALVRAALASEANAQKLIEKQQELVNQIMPVQQEYEQAMTQLQALSSPQDPNAQQIFQRAQQAEGKFQSTRQMADQQFGRFSAELARTQYDLIKAAVKEYAAENGYSHVLASRLSGELSVAGGLGGISDEILARPVMTFPEGTNITEAIREKLELPTEEEILAAEQKRQEEMRQLQQQQMDQQQGSGEAGQEPAPVAPLAD